ncbi:hypothetical protein N0V85_009886, partial [Neurospora sp. IMI 360204]
SVETTDTTLVLYKPEEFDVVMTTDADITAGTVTVNNPPPWLLALHEQLAKAHDQVRGIALAVGKERSKELGNLKEQYGALQASYRAATEMFRAGLEASQNQVAHFEQQIQQASTDFAAEVWTVIARYGKKDGERQKAFDQLQKVQADHRRALEALNERTTRLGRVENWATAKDSQINDILNKLVDPHQLKDLEEQIAAVQQNTQKAIQEAFKRSGQKAPDAASVLR